MSLTQIELRQLTWRKAMRSMNAGDCVEVAPSNGNIFVRDSKNPDGSWLICSAQSWQDFLAKIKVELPRRVLRGCRFPARFNKFLSHN
jgi:Domain of unknown function (DUF397)